MKQIWNEEELSKYWSLSYEEIELLDKKRTKSYLPFCLQLLYYRNNGAFPENFNIFPQVVINYVAEQLSVNIESIKRHNWDDRKSQRQRKDILKYLGISKLTDHNKETINNWLRSDIFYKGNTAKESIEYIHKWLHHQKIDRPSEKILDRESNAAYNQFEKEIFFNISSKFSKESKQMLDYCLEEKEEIISFSFLKSDPGRISLDTVLKEIEKLDFINQLNHPFEYLSTLNSKVLNRYKQRAHSESAWEVKRHPEHIRYALMGILIYSRRSEITDSLIELLMTVLITLCHITNINNFAI